MMNDDTLRAAYKDMSSALMASGESRLMLERAITARRRVRAGTAIGAASLAVIGAVGVAGVVTSQGVDSMQNTTPAASAGPDSEASLAAEYEWQNTIAPYQDELTSAAEGYDNYSGAEVIYSQRALIIYGTGQPSPEITDIMSNAPAAVEARWVTVPYSKVELEQAANQLSAAIPRAAFTEYAPDNYSNIIVGVDGLPTTEAGMQALRQLAASITDIPVVFEEAEGGMILPYIPSN
jgi:hypothetical protein